MAAAAEVYKQSEVYNTAQAFQRDPKLFFYNVLGVERLEPYQCRVIDTIAANERTTIRACHDLGKSFIMARAAMWFLNVFPHSKVITTAPTFTQVESILWSEIRAAHIKAKFPLGGRLNLTEWKLDEDWFALGFSPRKDAGGGEGQGTSSSFQGFHAPGGIMVIFDEATGIPPGIWTMAEGLLTQHNVKFVAIGNPTSTSSEFYRTFKDQAWAKVALTCFDSPNLQANGITTLEKLENEIRLVQTMNDVEALKRLDSYKVVRPYLLTTKWVVSNAKKWGINHPLTVSKILGEFPEAGDNTLMPLGLVEQSTLRTLQPSAHDRKCIGVDVARFGSDSSVLTSLHGPVQTGRKEFFKRDTMEIAGEAIAESRAIGGADVIVVDGTGLGAGVVDALKQSQREGLIPKHCEIREVQFGAKADGGTGLDADKNNEMFANIKARMFSLLADDIKNPEGLQLLPESAYTEELPTILYRYDSKGRLVIESKDDYKKRTGRGSPDNADSLALANFGRYDELKIGNVTEEYAAATPTLAGSLTNKRNW